MPATMPRSARSALLLLAFPGVVGAAVFGELFAGERAEDVGRGSLAPCPDKPNCVSSLADGEQAVAPFAYRGDAVEAMRLLASLATTLAGARVVTVRPDYLHVEFASRVVGFVDDFEAMPGPPGMLHVRSASRLGYGDFGVNRRRVERLRAAFGAANGRAVRP